MISGATSCFPNIMSQGLHMCQAAAAVTEDVVSSNISSSEAHSDSLLYSLSLLKEKVHQVQSLVSILISPHQTGRHPNQSTSMALASMSTMIQEIIVTASSMMFTCQQMSIGNNSNSCNNVSSTEGLHPPRGKAAQDQSHLVSQPNLGGNPVGNISQERGPSFFSTESFEWPYSTDNYNTSDSNRGILVTAGKDIISRELSQGDVAIMGEGLGGQLPKINYDIIELDAADLLAKYTHYCQVCGKGFKRDANLRMHMRAHGDEYKTSAALSNPMKSNPIAMESKESSVKLLRKYSCPHEGCRWNKKHARFQPLKSMICAKNHYKRSHCPKMYVCKRCNRKQFSVLSDLRTHEKHCGDLKWQCSCGTTFSRKDKLMGHVALFLGHTAVAVGCLTNPTKGEHQATQMQLDHDRG